MFLYDSDESDDYSENSEYEYTTLAPYVYELNTVKEVKETPEDKLLKYIQNNEFSEIKLLMPSLLQIDDKPNNFSNNVENLNNSISENGDAASDSSNDDNELSDCEDDEQYQFNSKSKYKEIILKNGDTPLMTATTEGNAELVEYFLYLGYDVNYKLPNSNKTALFSLFSKSNSSMWSIDRNSDMIERLVQCLQILINAGADVSARSFISSQEYGNNVLHFAVQNNYWEMLEILIHAGADIDAMNNQKATPLHIAASKGNVSCCNILLLAGANAQLVDKSGSTAAQLAEHQGYNNLSDAINIYCGHARHNVRLYKTWMQFAPKFKNVDHDSSFTDINDTIALNHSCIESFCLALNAPFLLKLVEDQGISMSDLKIMDEKKLLELGVPESDCKNLITAMKDLSKKTKFNSKKINYAYGKPLKPITILEMIGNIGEHIEFIDTNLQSMFCHMNRNEKFYLDKFRIVNKSTIINLKVNSKKCIEATEQLLKQVENLKQIIDEEQNHYTNDEDGSCVVDGYVNKFPGAIADQICQVKQSQKNSSHVKSSVFISLTVAFSLSAIILYRRFF